VIALPRIAITGVGLASPNASSLADYRAALLSGKSGVRPWTVPVFGDTLAGICDFDALKHQSKKEVRRGTRAGSISVWCAHEALLDAGLSLEQRDRQRVGVYVGTTEHGNVETETEVLGLAKYDNDVRYWSHHHNPRTVANNPAGEVTLSLGITGPAYCLGGACAAGNLGLIHGVQMLQLGEVDLAIAGGVSESPRAFGIFASFHAQNALGTHADPARASRPFDKARNGIVVSEGGCLFTLERLDDARARGAKIYGIVAGYAVNSDASDFVLPDSAGQERCIRRALAHAGLAPSDIDVLNTHATSTPSGDIAECRAIRAVFGESSGVHVNNTKSFLGHTMGAAGALELAGNLPGFADGLVHPTINVDELDPECELAGLVLGAPRAAPHQRRILNMSFGMLGINSAVIVERPDV
jgi:3-oxoacyl-[acyl-carrier-protein] synthase II